MAEFYKSRQKFKVLSFILLKCMNQIMVQLEDNLSLIDSSECIISGVDWNCCVDCMLDRTGQETHFESSNFLSHVLTKMDLIDV